MLPDCLRISSNLSLSMVSSADRYGLRSPTTTAWLTHTMFLSLPSSVLNRSVHMKKIRSWKVTSIIGVISSSHLTSESER